jgi:hypothetical protein
MIDPMETVRTKSRSDRAQMAELMVHLSSAVQHNNESVNNTAMQKGQENRPFAE